MCRPTFVALLVAIWCVAVTPAATASPDDPPIVVTPGDPVGRSGQPSVDLGVHEAGSAAAGPHGRSASGTGAVRCVWVAAPEVEEFVRGLPARLPDPGQDRIDPGARLFQRVCGGVPGEFAWLGPGSTAAAGATPAELARQAAAQLRLPAPTGGHSPALRLDGRDAVLVGEHTWLWTSPERFRPRTRLLRLGAVWARVTARPTSLSFDPGNGAAVVTCNGLGTAYVPGRNSPHAASPTCDYRYGRSSAGWPGGVVAASYAITWQVSWVGAVGTASALGELPDMASRLSVPLVVAEVQAIGTAE
jgi:hypothetical protein